MCGSYHFDMAMNIEIGVQYQNFLFVVFKVAVKCNLGHLQGIENVRLLQ